MLADESSFDQLKERIRKGCEELLQVWRTKVTELECNLQMLAIPRLHHGHGTQNTQLPIWSTNEFNDLSPARSPLSLAALMPDTWNQHTIAKIWTYERSHEDPRQQDLEAGWQQVDKLQSDLTREQSKGSRLAIERIQVEFKLTPLESDVGLSRDTVEERELELSSHKSQTAELERVIRDLQHNLNAERARHARLLAAIDEVEAELDLEMEAFHNERQCQLHEERSRSADLRSTVKRLCNQADAMKIAQELALERFQVALQEERQRSAALERELDQLRWMVRGEPSGTLPLTAANEEAMELGLKRRPTESAQVKECGSRMELPRDPESRDTEKAEAAVAIENPIGDDKKTKTEKTEADDEKAEADTRGHLMWLERMEEGLLKKAQDNSVHYQRVARRNSAMKGYRS